jgi:short-subunit dehydrogenase
VIATPKTVVITGASSGIGEALAVRYARAGTVLGVTGRNRERLERVAERCRAAGCDVRPAVLDVRDRSSLAAWLQELDRAFPIDLLIANAGVTTGVARGRQDEDADAAFELMEINILGVLNTVQPVLPLMLTRGRGQIAIMSSVSALSALPDAPSYSASKAAMLSYGVALRDRVYDAGVRVNVLCPGYVSTPMTARFKGWLPLEMTVETAAARIVSGLARDRPVIAFPLILVLLARGSRLLPDGLRRLGMMPFRFHVTGPQDR